MGKTTPGLETGLRIDYGNGPQAVTAQRFVSEWARIGKLHRNRRPASRPVERAREPRGRHVTTRAATRGPPSSDEDPHEHPPGRLPPAARVALDGAWLEVLRARHPEAVWQLARPGERAERHPPAAGRKVVGALAAPEQERALANGDAAAALDEDRVEDGAE